MSSISSCPHVTTVGDYTREDIQRKQEQARCDTCGAVGASQWACLYRDCLYVGCGEKFRDHSTKHFQQKSEHALTINLSSLRVWCYVCDCEVFLENNTPPLKLLNPSHVFIAETETPEEDSDSSGAASPSTPTSVPAPTSSYQQRPRGLTGLQNLGNTCYMNAALQALSNTPQLTQYFLDCDIPISSNVAAPPTSLVAAAAKKITPGLAGSFTRLIRQMWHKRQPSYVVPSGIAYGIKMVCPVFRGYSQQDAQEFLRCFMDQLHDELKEEVASDGNAAEGGNNVTHVVYHHHSAAHAHPPPPHRRRGSSSSSMKESEGNESEKEGGPLRVNAPDDNTHMRWRLRHQSRHSSLSEDDAFETCDSGLSSEQSSHSSLSSQEQPAHSKGGYSAGGGDWPLHIAASNTQPSTDSAFGSMLFNDNPVSPHFGGRSISPLSGHSTLRRRSSGGSASRTRSPPQQGITSNPCEPPYHFPTLPSGQKRRKRKALSGGVTSGNQQPVKKEIQYRSIISDVFDGKLLSSVQCLTCDTVSSTKETFQDLSLPIPSRDHVHMLHQQQVNAAAAAAVQHQHGTANSSESACSGSTSSSGATSDSATQADNTTTTVDNPGWISWILSWLWQWLWGPTITLHHCLSAFFSADELKGDNMYSCEKCKKLRNGIKYSRVLELPEVLCIHLKRFRHEVLFSSKISNHVNFPLEGLDMSAFLHPSCKSSTAVYNLMAVICHHGTVGSGHYTSYALNAHNQQWYEFDDIYVTSVEPQVVQNCEAYVLFYRKTSDEAEQKRQRTLELIARSRSLHDPAQYYVSKRWITRFNTFADPGPIDQSDFLCPHGCVRSESAPDRCVVLSAPVWEYLHQTFGGGPACTHLYECQVCNASTGSQTNDSTAR